MADNKEKYDEEQFVSEKNPEFDFFANKFELASTCSEDSDYDPDDDYEEYIELEEGTVISKKEWEKRMNSNKNDDDTSQEIKANMEVAVPEVSNPKASFKCDHCEYQTNLKRTLKRHKMYKHSIDAKIEWLKCNQCEYKAKVKADLKRHHEIKHLNGDLTKSFNCEHKTKTKQKLQVHQIHKHLNDDQIKKCFKCRACAHKAKKRIDLKRHYEIKHLGNDVIRWFQCNQCEFKTRRKTNLTSHIICGHLSDDEIQWFQCDQCEYKGKIKSAVRKHKLRMHCDPDQWFQCEFCKYKGKTKIYLKKHMKCHDRKKISMKSRN